MNVSFRPLEPEDAEAVVGIFNYYIENSFAAYPETTVPTEFFGRLMALCENYPNAAAVDENGEVVGFGMLRPYHSAPTFRATAEITYFLRADSTNRSVGRKLLAHLENQGREKGIENILASISSRNEASLKFHGAMGFTPCGRFREIGRKRGETFDVVYMQKKL